MNQDLNPIQIPIKPYGLDLTVQAVEQPNSTDVQRLLRNDKAKMSCLVTFPVLELAYNPIRRYSFLALSKISKLALTGYKNSGVQPTFYSGFFVRQISMRPHRYVELGRDIFGCASYLNYWSVNPFKLRTNQMTVISEAPLINSGAHSHA